MGKIIQMYEFKKDSEAVKQTIKENLFECDEEETVDVEMPLQSEEDVETLLSSYLPYEEKLKILKSERAKATRLAKYMEDAEHDFYNTKDFINQMKDNKKELARSIKTSILTTASGAGVSALGIGISAAYLSNHSFSSMNLGQTGAFFIFCVGMPILSLISGGFLYNDIYEYKQYDKEIRRYRKLLKK